MKNPAEILYLYKILRMCYNLSWSFNMKKQIYSISLSFFLSLILTVFVALTFSSSNRMFLIPDIYFRGGFISDSRIILFACMKKDCRSSRQPSLDNSYSSCCIVMFLLPLDVVLYISLNHFACQRENCHIIQLSYNRDAIRNDIKRIYNVENCADDR